MPANAVGWRLNLNQPGGTWRGEKVLGEATTINNAVVFTTYTPSTGIPADPCAPTLGTNRAYAVKVRDGSPVRIDGAADVTDRYDDFVFGGIAGDISTMVLGTDPVPCTGDDCRTGMRRATTARRLRAPRSSSVSPVCACWTSAATSTAA